MLNNPNARILVALFALYAVGMAVIAGAAQLRDTPEPLASQLKLVDVSLEPSVVYAPPGETVTVYVTVTGAGVPLVTLDALLTWEGLELLTAEALVPRIEDGFLNDPEGINDDVTDGEALFTILAPPAGPWMYATENGTPLVRLTFLVLRLGPWSVRLIPASGEYARTCVYPPEPPNFELTGANKSETKVHACGPRRVKARWLGD